MGYLEQPHTSAGRVPTAKGYRTYVENLMGRYYLALEEVEVLDEDGWKEKGYDKGAAGLCINGGKKIAYRDKYMQGYDFVLQCICHECFHAFQHTATNAPYAEWYYDDMGVTRGRVAQWSKNFSCYVGDVNSIAYKVEIVECDANAFADDCHLYSKSRWHEIEFV
jgi:hypothetical protein